MVLSAPGGGRISIGSDLRLRHLPTPICEAPGGSILQASRFLPIVPQGPRSSALPLRARIVPSGHVPYANDTSRTFPVVTAAPGSWLSYTVVLTNHSAKTFSFARHCPAYVESVEEGRQAAYVLNCHAVPTIAPHASARFAIRLRVPQHLKVGDSYSVTWNLAPHSWNAPFAQISLRLR